MAGTRQAHAVTYRPDDHPFFKEVRLGKTFLRPGDEQSLDVRVKNPVQEVIVVSATVRYPSGAIENLSVATQTTSGQIAWRVPEDQPLGFASVAVSAGSGGCCGGDLRKRGLGTLTPVRGSFRVEPPRNPAGVAER